MPRHKPEQKAHEVITIYSHNGVCKNFMDKYIVVAPTTSAAISMIPLREGEEILQAKELVDHHLIMVGKK